MTLEHSRDAAMEDGRARLQDWRRDRLANFFDGDPFLQSVLERHLGNEWSDARKRLEEVGAIAAGPMDVLARACELDHARPRVERFSPIGERSEEIRFDPSYHELGRLFWSTGALALIGEPGNELLAGAITYLADHNGEAGHACPVACTAGAIKLLQQLGSPGQRERYLARLLSDDYDSALRASQFVTEIQGGSDVGANACVAEPDPDRAGWYRLAGEKWFCSVADADLFVVSARVPDGAPGTRGLGLFLVPRTIDGAINGFTVNRLKEKLGTRALATAEIEFEGALGEPIGPLGDGFRNLVAIVLDTSRVHNAVSACAAMRRAYIEAFTYAGRRLAFGQAINRYPAVQSTLARMKLATMAGIATTFRILAMTDRLTTGDRDSTTLGARRVDVMLNKYWTAIHATSVVRDGIEVLGGNGTIEDFSVLPRLYRDTIVLESWEGTHNTLVAQILRDFMERDLHTVWLDQVRKEIELPREAGAPREMSLLNDHLARVEASIRAAVDGDGLERRHFRHVVDRMCALVDQLALRQQAMWEARQGVSGTSALAAELHARIHLLGESAISEPRIGELEGELAGTL